MPEPRLVSPVLLAVRWRTKYPTRIPVRGQHWQQRAAKSPRPASSDYQVKGASGEWNIGQLVRQKHGIDSSLVGFTTYTGTVTAASNWDAPAERKRVRPGLEGSYEALFHATGVPAFLVNLRGASCAGRSLDRSQARTCDRSCLHAPVRAHQPLLSCAPPRPVRRRDSFAPDTSGRTFGAVVVLSDAFELNER